MTSSTVHTITIAHDPEPGEPNNSLSIHIPIGTDAEAVIGLVLIDAMAEDPAAILGYEYLAAAYAAGAIITDAATFDEFMEKADDPEFGNIALSGADVTIELGDAKALIQFKGVVGGLPEAANAMRESFGHMVRDYIAHCLEEGSLTPEGMASVFAGMIEAGRERLLEALTGPGGLLEALTGPGGIENSNVRMVQIDPDKGFPTVDELVNEHGVPREVAEVVYAEGKAEFEAMRKAHQAEVATEANLTATGNPYGGNSAW